MNIFSKIGLGRMIHVNPSEFANQIFHLKTPLVLPTLLPVPYNKKSTSFEVDSGGSQKNSEIDFGEDY
jgi:hypothetical protein